MSDQQWTEIPVSELPRIRIECKHKMDNIPCDAIVEVSIGKLASIANCPLCGNPLHPPTNPAQDPFALLPAALKALADLTTVKVFFLREHKD
jgi:hypothetical protein